MPLTLNIKGQLHTYHRPLVMGVLNATPDSFHAASRAVDSAAVGARVAEMISEGADIIDVGAYSTRPGHSPVSADEELRRLEMALGAVRSVSADIPVSVDTFVPEVARRALRELGADIINDVSGGSEQMTEVVAQEHAPYVLTHSQKSHSADIVAEVLKWLAFKTAQLNLAGVNDVIVDPGFGFGKTMEENYLLMGSLEVLVEQLRLPVLVGVSRKRMVTEALGVEPSDALSGTIAFNTVALQKGAMILRVHDVAAARHTIGIVRRIEEATNTIGK